MDRDGLPRRGVGGVGLLVLTSGGERRKAPLLGTYGDDVMGANFFQYEPESNILILNMMYFPNFFLLSVFLLLIDSSDNILNNKSSNFDA